MATSNLAIFPQTIKAWAVQILPADGTNTKTLVTGGANGSIVESINVSTNDSAGAQTLFLGMNNGTTSFEMGAFNIPTNAGNVSGTAAVDLLRVGNVPGLPVDANGNYVIFVPNGWTLYVQASAAVPTSDNITAVAMGADY